MKRALASTLLFALIVWTSAPRAADDPALLRLSTCQDSWLDWKNDDARMARFVDGFERQFVPAKQAAAFEPKAPMTLLGHPVAQVFPQSVGMGLGFSVLVNAPFTQARQSFEKQLGQPLKCSTSDGMKACELTLGEEKTAMLMAADSPGGKTTLMGCYYYYEK